MGRTNLEHFSVHQFREGFSTAGQLARGGWEVMAQCDGCGRQHRISLKAILEHPRLGPDFPMWDRRPKCRLLGCGRRMYLWARMPGHPSFQPLVSDQVHSFAPFTRRLETNWQYGTARINGRVVSRPFEPLD